MAYTSSPAQDSFTLVQIDRASSRRMREDILSVKRAVGALETAETRVKTLEATTRDEWTAPCTPHMTAFAVEEVDHRRRRAEQQRVLRHFKPLLGSPLGLRLQCWPREPRGRRMTQRVHQMVSHIKRGGWHGPVSVYNAVRERDGCEDNNGDDNNDGGGEDDDA